MTGFFGIPIHNGLGIGLSGAASLASSPPAGGHAGSVLLMETGDDLLLETGDSILLE
jgi:hypothetical protein